MVRASGGHIRPGHLSTQGATWLRWILVEAAHPAPRRPGRYRDLYTRLARRKGTKVARVAVARELLTNAYWIPRHAT